ncbi:MAG: deoxyribonuclease IV [Bacteroidales bacterium]|nr:deoxyribonuclease IV [Bacteroidales bacterium]
MKYIGAHVSASGGVQNAPQNAKTIAATAFALFTKNQRQWTAKDLSAEEIGDFKKNCIDAGFAPCQILPHDSYLINLGNPDAEKRAKSVASFIHETRRCHDLGLTMLNLHPGSHLNETAPEGCLDLIAESLNTVLRETRGVTAVIENTAGQGTNMGFALWHIAHIIERIEDKSRVGVCIDTCHTFAAGYDIASPEGYEAFWQEFDSLIGRDYLRAMHLNDCLKPRGSRVDRHAPLGQGTLGIDAFRRIVQDPRTDNIPLILETPDESLWPDEIALLKSFA